MPVTAVKIFASAVSSQSAAVLNFISLPRTYMVTSRMTIWNKTKKKGFVR